MQCLPTLPRDLNLHAVRHYCCLTIAFHNHFSRTSPPLPPYPLPHPLPYPFPFSNLAHHLELSVPPTTHVFPIREHDYPLHTAM